MTNDWLNLDPDDGFDPNDHGVEMDEIAKLHAMADMKDDQRIWAREQAHKFYDDFEGLDITDSVSAVNCLIEQKALNIDQVSVMLDNMIEVFILDEEFEKCFVCNEIKKGLKAC